MYEFDYKRPASLADAVSALQAAEDGSLLAGGHTLLPTLKQRLARPSDLIDISQIGELSGISVDGDTVIVGATTTHAAVEGSDTVRGMIPALADLAGIIGDPQVRHRGTIGGSIANNDPAADYPGAVLGLGATVVTNSREIAADDFFQGLFETALAEDEIITAVRFPKPEKAAYMKFPQPASRFSLVGAFVAKTSRRRPCRGNRCRTRRGVPHDGDGTGARRQFLRRRHHQYRGCRMPISTPTSTVAPSIARIWSV